MSPFGLDLAELAIAALLAYLLGSVSFGILISRVLDLADPRTYGSRNAGATNVLRSGNKVAALLTLVLDIGKGIISVVCAEAILGGEAAIAAGLFVFLGHLWPVWYGFAGGKGVATYLGIVLALNPLAGAIACVSWLVAAGLVRISSVASLTTAITGPLAMAFLGTGSQTFVLLVVGALIWFRHQDNISRLLMGKEPTIRLRGSSDDP